MADRARLDGMTAERLEELALSCTNVADQREGQAIAEASWPDLAALLSAEAHDNRQLAALCRAVANAERWRCGVGRTCCARRTATVRCVPVDFCGITNRGRMKCAVQDPRRRSRESPSRSRRDGMSTATRASGLACGDALPRTDSATMRA